jgi:uncharacterized membrane protein
MVVNCLLRPSAGGMLCGLLGAGLLTRALSNRNVGEALGLAGEHRAIDVQKTITIDAPLEEVYSFFAEPKNLERISDMITKVETRPRGGFTKHMLIGGVPVRMDERFVRKVPHELIETHSEGESPFEYTKEICFERSGGGTRVDVLFSYMPPGGVLAHAAAGALGFDPKTLLADLLMRAKSTLETGRLPHDASKTSHAGQSQRSARTAEGTRTETLGGAAVPTWPRSQG